VKINPCSDCNLVFISIDTLRAKNVHFLGYPKNTTPFLDQLTQKSFVFTKDISVSSWTLPATMSWFAGVYPSTHKILNKVTVLPDGKEIPTSLATNSPNLLTLAQILKANGFVTGGFTGGAGVDHEFGFNQGFDVYSDKRNFGGFKDSIPEAISWIKDHKNERFFVFLHGYDVHGQYVPDGGYDHRFVDFNYQGKLTGSAKEQKELREEGLTRGHLFLTPEDVKFLIALYDEKIQRADDQLKTFFDQLNTLNPAHKTIFIITADHGEEFYEHGQLDHGHSLYDELIHVPLIISMPENNSEYKIDDQVRSIDLMPTALSLLGVKLTPQLTQQLQGTDLTYLMEGKHLSLDIYPETDYRYAVSLRAIRTADNWKFISNQLTNNQELFNLNNDQSEQNNLPNSTNRYQSLLDQVDSQFHLK
jgi:arylsulfatase